MKNTIFNKRIYIEYPENFYEMSGEEIKKFFGSGIDRIGFKNVEKHVILSLGKTNESFLNLFATPRSVLAGAENSLKSLPNYKRIEELDVEMLSKKGCGISFEYSATDKDVKQYCEIAIVKHKNNFYISYCLSRLADKKDNAPLFKTFRDSMKIAD